MPKVLSAPDVSQAAPRPQTGEAAEQSALSESLRQVDALFGLAAGWNGADALPPAAESVRHARTWLEAQWRQCRSEGIRWYAPNVTASAEGEAVFEWWAADRTLSVYFGEDLDNASKDRTVDYLKFGRREGPLADLREQGIAETVEEAAALMRWFGE